MSRFLFRFALKNSVMCEIIVELSRLFNFQVEIRWLLSRQCNFIGNLRIWQFFESTMSCTVMVQKLNFADHLMSMV